MRALLLILFVHTMLFAGPAIAKDLPSATATSPADIVFDIDGTLIFSGRDIPPLRRRAYLILIT